MIVGIEESRHRPSDANAQSSTAIRVSLKRDLSHLSRRYTRYLLTSHSEIVDIEKENQTHGIARTKSGRMIAKDIENMTIIEYMEYEAEMKRHPWGYAQSYTRSLGSTTLGRKKDPNDYDPCAPNSHHEDKEVSTDEDVDEWLNAKMGQRMIGKDKGEEEDALIDILKTVLYVMDDLGASVNVMPKLLFEHLKLADLKETNMMVGMADMTKKAPLGIVENILVKINKFLFHSNFVVIDMLEGPNKTMLLGKPFLGTIHAQIDVFKREISLGIGEEEVTFDMNGEICHSRVPFEIFYMASSVQESEYFNPLEIKTDAFS
ncbi:copia protein [Tanacetum coccineum]